MLLAIETGLVRCECFFPEVEGAMFRSLDAIWILGSRRACAPLFPPANLEACLSVSLPRDIGAEQPTANQCAISW